MGDTLIVTFSNKSRYVYGEVSSAEYRAIMQAVSKGKVFWNRIRDIKPVLHSTYRRKINEW